MKPSLDHQICISWADFVWLAEDDSVTVTIAIVAMDTVTKFLSQVQLGTNHSWSWK